MVTTTEKEEKKVAKTVVPIPESMDSVTIFRQELGRDPTEQDLNWLEGELRNYDLQCQGFASQRAEGSVSAGIAALREVHHAPTQ